MIPETRKAAWTIGILLALMLLAVFLGYVFDDPHHGSLR